MKKIMLIFGAIAIASFIMTSCGGNSIESDAKKVAELQCKAQQLMQKATSGDMSVMEESTKLATEAATLSKEMEGKYTSDSDKEKFANALLKELGICGGKTIGKDESQDCIASNDKDLEVCYKDKSVSDLATFYCKWAKIEADAKTQHSEEKEKDADNHTDAIQKIIRHRADADKEKFRELTKDCKEHN
jgi:hypothetical protein